MNIDLHGFRIKTSEGITKFDLYKVTVAQKGNKEGQEIERAEAYGVSMERCLLIIAQRSLDENLNEADIQKYIKEYKVITEKLVSEVKELI